MAIGTRMRAGLGLMVMILFGVGLAVAQNKSPKTEKVEPGMVGHETMGGHKMVAPDQIKWGKVPAGLPPGGEAALLDGDPSSPGLYILRLRLPDGYRIRPHWHTKAEQVTVLSGHFSMGTGDQWSESQMKEFGQGGYLSMPGGQRHFAMAHGETVIQLSNIGPFDIMYVNPSDDPRNQRSSR